MSRTKIEWCLNPDGSPGFTWSPITGCLGPDGKGPCPYCYARKLAHGRLADRYLSNYNFAPGTGQEGEDPFQDPFWPRAWPERLQGVCRPKLSRAKPRGIFVCDMSDLFGLGIPEEWTRQVMDAIRANTVDRFYLLTKQPQNLAKFSPFPENCWVGASATNYDMFTDACAHLDRIKKRVTFLSLEPLLNWGPQGEHLYTESFLRGCGIQWVIIGAQTKPTVMPRIEWVCEIVEAADKAGAKVFIKNNLKPLLMGDAISGQSSLDSGLLTWAGELRQEVPNV